MEEKHEGMAIYLNCNFCLTFITQVLIDEAQASLYQVRMFSKAIGQRSADDFNMAALETAMKQLSTFCDQLQVLLLLSNFEH